MPTGRFAPSPSGSLHLGNLRTALCAWLFARSTGSSFLIRVEDLDPVTSKREHESAQLHDLEQLGLDWDGPVVRQSERSDLYRDALSTLTSRGLVYECWCSRREIAEASRAPNSPDLPDGAYPGTCRMLTRAQRQTKVDQGRRPAIRLQTSNQSVTFTDAIHGTVRAQVDDVVLARSDGVAAYNLAVVVDDALQGVRQVVRGDDLLTSTPRQMLISELLGLPSMSYAHVPLVRNADGRRLSKRDGAVSLADQRARGRDAAAVVAYLGASLNLCEATEVVTVRDLLRCFRVDALPKNPWVFHDG